MTSNRRRPATWASSPTPKIEPGEPNPGGVTRCRRRSDNIPADLGPETNPAVEESPDPLKKVLEEGEDTDTKATESSDGGDEDVEPEKESPA